MSTMPTEVKIAKMALRALRNNNIAINLFYKDLNSEFGKVKEGGVVNVKKPIKFQSALGRTAQIQPYSQTTIPVKVDMHRHVAWEQNMIDATLVKSEKQLYKDLVEPAMIEIAAQVDLDLFTLVKDIPNAIGTAGTTPTTFLSVAQVAGRMTDISVPLKKRNLVVDSAYQVSMADALKTMYNPKLVEDYLQSMYIGGLAEFNVFISQNLPRLTVGVPGGTPLINGANQTGSSIAIDGLSATGTYKKGDIVTFASCYEVNPVNRVTQTFLKQFVVTADFTASGGAGNLSIEPAIVTTGAYKNCSASPANNDAITHKTSSDCQNNIAFVKDTFAFVSVPIEIPDMPGVGHTETDEGLSVTVTKGWDVKELQMVYRIDFLYGKKTLYAEQACRHLG
mgnify:CR=1 FL=1